MEDKEQERKEVERKDEKYMKLYLLCMKMQSPVPNSGEMYEEKGERALD